MALTKKDIERIRGGWYSITALSLIDSITAKAKGNDVKPLAFDLSVSRYDRRDWIVSFRNDISLDQDGGFMASYSKAGYSVEELKAELVDLANEWIEDHV